MRKRNRKPKPAPATHLEVVEPTLETSRLEVGERVGSGGVGWVRGGCRSLAGGYARISELQPAKGIGYGSFDLLEASFNTVDDEIPDELGDGPYFGNGDLVPDSPTSHRLPIPIGLVQAFDPILDLSYIYAPVIHTHHTSSSATPIHPDPLPHHVQLDRLDRLHPPRETPPAPRTGDQHLRQEADRADLEAGGAPFRQSK